MADSVHALLGALFDEIEAHDGTEILGREGTIDPIDQSLIEPLHRMLSDDFGYQLPASVRDIVLFPDTVGLSWKVAGTDDPELIGEFHLENVINAVHLDAARISLDRADITEETRALFERARYFDAQPTQDWYVATVLMLDDSKSFPELWFMDHDVIHPMDLGIDGYFDALALTKGMYYWQYLYCAPEAYRAAPDYRKVYVRSLVDTLPRLFPNHDYSPLVDRFHQIE